MTELQPGTLLVASPTLIDPNFFRSVVLLMDADDDGAVGVILNRPLEIGAKEHLPAWCDVLAPPRRIFEGGPVRQETAIGVAVRPGAGIEETWRPVPGDMGFVDVSKDPNEIGGVAEARIYSGYAGWGGGQLEMEMTISSWFAVEGTVDDAFDPVPTTLWRRVLLRQEPHIARYANYPVDPRSN
jgi:putative transcriptional regulator